MSNQPPSGPPRPPTSGQLPPSQRLPFSPYEDVMNPVTKGKIFVLFP